MKTEALLAAEPFYMSDVKGMYRWERKCPLF